MSDIFDEYAKIMMDKGLIKKSNVMTSDEKEKDSDYEEKIKALYGINLKLNNSNKNIIEQAHPDKVIIAPSYDKLNGLVEDVQERHNVMVGICNKPVNGNLTQHRYAEKQLLNELIRLGNDLDNQEEEKLSKLADECALECSLELSKKKYNIKKEAWAPLMAVLPQLAIWGPRILWGVSAILTANTIKEKLYGNLAKNLKPATKDAIESLTELKENVDPIYSNKIDMWIKISKYLQDNADYISSMTTEKFNIDSLKSEENVKSEIKKSQSDTKSLIEFKKIAKYFMNHIGMATEMGGTGFLGEIANMPLNKTKGESDLWSLTKSLISPSNIKTKALNSMANLRKALSVYVKEFDEESKKANTNSKSTFNQLKDMISNNNLSDFVRQ